ncbi:MAG TPA: TIR domain-containing protein, partial [Caulobacteraceae bacterium]|nr:TIR domain-containing protein [Caulobacteraceae bacterium]
MSDIFISYARSTAREAQAMGEALRALGYSVWRDDDLPSHRSYSEVIEEQLGLAKAVLVVWSTEAVRSQWVRSEADKARTREKLVQLAVDSVDLPMPFDQIQCADLTGWSGETSHVGWIKILASIEALAGPGAVLAAGPEVTQMAVLAAEIEGIGVLLLNHHAALAEALTVATAAFRANAESKGGRVFRDADGVMMAAFPSPAAAVRAAVQAQGGLTGRDWPGIGVLKVRMAVHYGQVEPRGQDYFGPALNRLTPLLALAQGGQIMVTEALAERLSGQGDYSFKPLGAHALEDPLTRVELFQVGAEGLKADFAPIVAEAAPQVGNLPRRQGPLIGRDADMAQIGALFEAADLVTVTGTGGVGKTRIAIEYAHQRQDRHEDGVWLVELAPLADPEQVTGAIARALGVALPPGGDQVQALVDRLRPRDCLIVLDNCEHVIDAVAAVAEAALEQAPKVKLLASSQELIGVEGERVFRLRSLGEPDAIALFTERAKAADAGFTVRGRDAAAIAAICQRLDGIPLAIEMAAARAPSLGCEGVLQRLDDRFRILTGGRRTALPRQRTLQATLDWSHGLLPAEDAAVYRRVGVFTGGFTLEAASKVAADETLDAVEVIDAL